MSSTNCAARLLVFTALILAIGSRANPVRAQLNDTTLVTPTAPDPAVTVVATVTILPPTYVAFFDPARGCWVSPLTGIPVNHPAACWFFGPWSAVYSGQSFPGEFDGIRLNLPPIMAREGGDE